MSDLTGKHVVITGATGGLGASVVEAMLKRGATCHVPMLEPTVPDAAPWAGHERIAVTGSVALDDEEAVEAFYGELPGLWASIHLVGGFAMAPITATSGADLRRMVDLNLVPTFLCCREAVRVMGGPGRLVNVAARPVLQPGPDVTAYAAAKGAVAALTTCLAAEVRHRGVLVNAVVPSIIDTPANRRAMPDADHTRWPKPAELAETIAFLASPANTVTSGALVPVFGRA